MSIELHIERLVIDEALLQGQRVDRVCAIIERELTQHLAGAGTLEHLRGLGTLACLPTASLRPAARPHEQLGARIASAVRQGLGLPAALHGQSVVGHD